MTESKDQMYLVPGYPIYPGDDRYLPPAGQGADYCRSVLRREGVRPYGCTREADHAGDHTAHGTGESMHARWGGD